MDKTHANDPRLIVRFSDLSHKCSASIAWLDKDMEVNVVAELASSENVDELLLPRLECEFGAGEK